MTIRAMLPPQWISTCGLSAPWYPVQPTQVGEDQTTVTFDGLAEMAWAPKLLPYLITDATAPAPAGPLTVYQSLEIAARAAALRNGGSLWYIGQDASWASTTSATGGGAAAVGDRVGRLSAREQLTPGQGRDLVQSLASARPQLVMLGTGMMGLEFDGSSSLAVDQRGHPDDLHLAGNTLIYAHEGPLTGLGGCVLVEGDDVLRYSLAQIGDYQPDIMMTHPGTIDPESSRYVLVTGLPDAAPLTGVFSAVDDGSSLASFWDGESGNWHMYSPAGYPSTRSWTIGGAGYPGGMQLAGRFALICQTLGVMPDEDRKAIERFGAHLVGSTYYG